MHDVFISHASEDEGAAQRLARALEARGWSVFWGHTIPRGKSWDEVVGAELAAAPCQIVLWSSHSVDSVWVLEEARRGLARGNLIAAYLEDIAPPPGFGGRYPAALLVWDGDDLAIDCQLPACIAALIGPPSAVPRPPAAEDAPPPFTEDQVPEKPAPAAAPAGESPPRPDAERPRVPSAEKPEADVTDLPAPPEPSAPARPEPSAAGPARPGPRTPAPETDRTGRALMVRPERGPSRPRKRRTDEPELVSIPAGTFRLPAPPDGRSADVVRIVKAFAIGRYPVTFEQYDRFAAATGRPPPPDRGWGRGRRPVINVSWDDARAYTRWLAKRAEKRYRLPTDAEWRYLVGVEREVYRWNGASREPELGADEWYWPRYGLMTHPVNAFRPDDLGIYDLRGNVWEWVDPGHQGEAAAPLCLSLDRRLDVIGFRVALHLD